MTGHASMRTRHRACRDSPSSELAADPWPTGATSRADSVALSVASLEGRLVMMGWYGHGMGAWEWALIGLFWVVMIGLIVLCTIAFLTARSRDGSRSTRDGGSDSRDDSATAILDRRFARGEIDEETFQAHRAALTSPARHVDDASGHAHNT